MLVYFLKLKWVCNIVQIGDVWQHKSEKSSVLEYSSSGMICELRVYSIAAVKGLIESGHLHIRELKVISLKSIISIYLSCSDCIIILGTLNGVDKPLMLSTHFAYPIIFFDLILEPVYLLLITFTKYKSIPFLFNILLDVLLLILSKACK